MDTSVVDFYRHAPDYDAEYADLTADIAWSKRLCRMYARGGHVLEMACGTGRITLPIAWQAMQLGYWVTGVDLSPDMLSRASAKVAAEDPSLQSQLQLIEGDMRTVNAGIERYNLVLVPFHSFAHLLTTHDQRAALHNCHNHLQVGGHFVADVFLPDPAKLAHGLTRHAPIIEREAQLADGYNLVRSYTTRYHPATQLLEVTYFYNFYDAIGRLIANRCYRSQTTMRMIFPAEWELLLADAGFTIIDRWSDYDGTPFGTGHGMKMLFLCQRT
ncbi:class I SAM-dependent methyltransferase [candidate division WWE3 bacterium]|nr:class I SAM-dependent methyltransferase [candidate division WWE3 bacterium]